MYHSFVRFDWLLYRQAVDITWLSNSPSISCSIHSYILAGCHTDKLIIQQSIHIVFHSFIRIGWLLHRQLAANITWLSNTPFTSYFIRSYLLPGWYKDRLHISSDCPPVYPYPVSFIHTYKLVVTHTDCGYYLIIQHSTQGISCFIYSYLLAGWYKDRLQISLGYPTIHPYRVSFIHTYWLVVTKTDSWHYLVIQQSIHIEAHSFIHISWLLHRQTTYITRLSSSKSISRLIHSNI